MHLYTINYLLEGKELHKMSAYRNIINHINENNSFECYFTVYCKCTDLDMHKKTESCLIRCFALLDRLLNVGSQRRVPFYNKENLEGKEWIINDCIEELSDLFSTNKITLLSELSETFKIKTS
jgi:hypothetical protein